jgi:predicted metal-dependent peptidase
MAGKGSSNSEGVFGDLLNPRADWRKVLREFMTETCTARDEPSWRRPNRRYMHEDVYLPSLDGEAMGELVIGFDTSGSCFGTDHMSRVVSELQSIVAEVKPTRIVVAYWDTKVVASQVFESGTFDVKGVKPVGGGGTEGACLFDWLRKERINPQAIVQFTDGCFSDWGRSAWPTIWAVTDKDTTAPYGTTVHVEV